MATSPPSVVAELIRLLYRHVPAVLAANLINSSLIAFALNRLTGESGVVAD